MAFSCQAGQTCQQMKVQNKLIMQNNQAIQSVNYILGGALLQLFAGVGDNWACSLAAIFGFVVFLTGLGRLRAGLDEAGQRAVSILTIAAVIGAASSLFSMIPLLGILGGFGFMIAYTMELVGLLRFKTSASIGEEGKSGTILLVVAMGLAIFSSLLGMIPFVGHTIASFVALAALIMIFVGWTRIQSGLMNKTALNP
jgi:hypothetical protein